MTFLPAAEPRLVPLLPKGVTLPRVPLLDHLHAPFPARAACSPPSDAPETPAATSELCDERAWRSSIGSKRAGSSDSDDSASPSRKRAKPHKWRKPTYLVRKEERDVLLGEIRALEAKVQLLRRHAGLAPSCGVSAGGLPTLVDTELHNNLLRESMRNQQLQLLSAQSAISELAMHSLPQHCPLASTIQLRRDWNQRRDTLLGLKDLKLRDARQLLEKRTQFLERPGQLRHSVEHSQFVTEQGDLCALHFDVVPLEGLACVKQVFRSARRYMQHVQQANSREESNNVIHGGAENDDDDSGSILHRRVLISSEMFPTESNFVVFSELTPARNNNTSALSGLIAFDFVDEDELYPYRTSEFLRQNVTGALSISLRNSDSCAGANSEPVVVLTRWVFVTVHREGKAIPSKALEEARNRIERIGDEMVDSLRAECSSPPTR